MSDDLQVIDRSAPPAGFDEGVVAPEAAVRHKPPAGFDQSVSATPADRSKPPAGFDENMGASGSPSQDPPAHVSVMVPDRFVQWDEPRPAGPRTPLAASYPPTLFSAAPIASRAPTTPPRTEADVNRDLGISSMDFADVNAAQASAALYGKYNPQAGKNAIAQYIRQQEESMDAPDVADVTLPTGVSPEEAGMGAPGLMTIPGEKIAEAYKNVIAPSGVAGAEYLGSMVSPENAAMMGAFSLVPTDTLAGKALHSAIGTYFAGKMGSQGILDAYNTYLEEQNGNVPEAVQNAISALLNLGMAGAGIHDAAKAGRQSAVNPQGIVNEHLNRNARYNVAAESYGPAAKGSFPIRDWSGYPTGAPKPKGHSGCSKGRNTQSPEVPPIAPTGLCVKPIQPTRENRFTKSRR